MWRWCLPQAGRDLSTIQRPNTSTITEPPTSNTVPTRCPPAFASFEQPHKAVSRKDSSKSDSADGGDHADGHGRSHREPCREHPPRKRVAHDESGQRTRNHARHECERLAVFGVCVAVASQRTPEQEGTDERDQHAACSLELWRAPAISECPADNRESCKYQDQGESDVGQCEDRAIRDAVHRLGWLSEVVGDKDRFTVARHQGVDGTKQYGGGHGCNHGTSVAARHVAKAARHAAIEPVLQFDERVHGGLR